MNRLKIGLGGGCHWCTEAVFQALHGVVTVEQGFISSSEPNDSLSEAVLVTYDPQTISTADLIEIHLRTHSSKSNHQFRDKYRSAIYYCATNDKLNTTPAELKEILEQHIKESNGSLVTKILPCIKFVASEPQYQNYYLKGTTKPFCKTYIDPKLRLLREQYANHLF